MRTRILILLAALLYLGAHAQTGASIHLDGINDRAVVAASADFDLNEFTIQAWVKRDAMNGVAACIAGIRSNSACRFSLHMGNDAIATYNGSSASYLPMTLSANTWYHITAVVRQAYTQIYVNGVYKGVTGGRGTATGLPFIIGSSGSSGTGSVEQLNGTMDEVRLWNRALTSCEIWGNFNKSLTTPQAGLIANFTASQGTAAGNNTGITQLADVSGYGHHADLQNLALDGATSNFVATTFSYTPGTNLTLCDSNLPFNWNGLSLSSSGTYTYQTTGTGGCDSTAYLNLTVQAGQCATEGAALHFDGVNDRAVVPARTAFNVAQATVQAWLKRDVMNGQPVCFAGLRNGSATRFSLHMQNAEIGIWNGSNYAVVACGTFAANTWYQVTAVVKASSMDVYINGVLKGSVGLGMGSTTNMPFVIGSSGATASAGSEQFNGVIDEVRLWNRSLSACEIAQNYNKTLSGTQTGLLCYFKMNQGFVNTDNSWLSQLSDASGNAADATLTDFGLTGATSNFVATGGTFASAIQATVCSNSLPYVWGGQSLTASGTYSYQGSSAGGCDSLATLNLTVQNSIVPAATLSASPATLCQGSPVTLTAGATLGGSTVATPTLSWYKNGVLIPGASASTYSIASPVAGDSYYVRYTPDGATICPSAAFANSDALTFTACASASLSYAAALCAGKSISVPFTATNFGAGNTFTLQLSDASGSFANATAIGSVSGSSSGNIEAVIPVGTATGTGYRLRVSGTTPAYTSNDNGADISITRGGTPGASTSGSTTVAASSSALTSGACEQVAAIASAGGNPVSGTVTATVYVDGSVPTAAGRAYLPRRYDLSATDETSSAMLTLYYTQADFDAYNAAEPKDFLHLPANGTDAIELARRSRFRITQYHGTSATGLPGSYTYNGSAAPVVVIDPADNDIVWNAAQSRWEVTFAITGFSGFFAYGDEGTNIILPVSLVSFSGRKDGSLNKLRWTTASESNNRGFGIERSTDGRNFSTIGFVATQGTGGNSNSALSYAFEDAGAPASAWYRLAQTDVDGRLRYSATVLLRGDGSGHATMDLLYPNPARQVLNLVLQSPAAGTGQATIVDAQGRLQRTRSFLAGSGSNTLQLGLEGLSAGTYLLTIEVGGQRVQHAFVKQ